MDKLSPSVPPTFREVYCRVYGCEPGVFQSRVFWSCLHRRALPVAKLIHATKPKFFKHDESLVQVAAHLRTATELLNAINSYRQDCERDGGFWHNRMRLRLSGRRLFRLFIRVRDAAASPGKGTPASR